MFRDFRSAEDPEAPRDGAQEALQVPGAARSGKRRGVARPDRGTLRMSEVVNASGGAARRRLGHGPRPLAREPADVGLQRGADRGPQLGQRAPADGRRPAGQLLQPADPDGAGRARAGVRRPAGDRRARGELHRRQPLRAARPRARLRVERDLGGPGQHRHLRPAPVRAGRRQADAASMHYRFRGACLPIEVLEKTDTWQPTAGDDTPAGHADAARRADQARARRGRARSCAAGPCCS